MLYRLPDPYTGAVATRWMIDIQLPDGKRVREICPVQSKRAATRYERKRRIELFDRMPAPGSLHAAQPTPPPVEPQKEVPTFGAFAKVFMAT